MADVVNGYKEHTQFANICLPLHYFSRYGLCVVSLEAFVVYKCVSRFLLYLALPWPDRKQPYLELNLFVGLVGAGVVLLPFESNLIYWSGCMYKSPLLASKLGKISTKNELLFQKKT